MLRVPVVGTYHTDFPAYLDRLARDHRVTNGTIAYMTWFYARQLSAVFTRSSAYRFSLRDLGVADARMRAIVPGVNTTKFNPAHREPGIWNRLGVREPLRLLSAGRVSVEKNLPLLVDVFTRLCATRRDAALVVAGEGPYLDSMRQRLAHLPAYFLGPQEDAPLAELYASSDLLLFPSRTDTLGQVVIEAQSSGLPALVSNEGGPKETVEHDATGLVLTSSDAGAWCDAIEQLLDDEPASHAGADVRRVLGRPPRDRRARAAAPARRAVAVVRPNPVETRRRLIMPRALPICQKT
jgi:glycosyltransferase involved in cell wall biosynthesis